MAASLTSARQQLTSFTTARAVLSMSSSRPCRPSQIRAISTTKALGSSPSGAAAAGPFSFHVAASFIGKERRYDPSTHVFHFNPRERFHKTRDNKRARPDSGHDAFFASRVGDTGAVALGVADGVGGWVESGVDPADFSHGLCEYIAEAAYDLGSNPSSGNPPAASRAPTARSLLQTGYQAVCEDESIRAGSSTACVAVASSTGSFDIANLGDSGFIQLRLGGVHAYSDPQTHAFNTPFQLSVVPPSIAARMAVFGGSQLRDFPRDADVTRHEARHGDILILASDGVWDNLFNQDILRIANRVMASTGAWVTSPANGQDAEHHDGGIRVIDDLQTLTAQDGASPGGKPPQRTLQSLLATEITGAANAASINNKRDGPFAKEVQKWFPQENWRGGKVDDVMVVVAIVSDDSKAAPLKSKL